MCDVNKAIGETVIDSSKILIFIKYETEKRIQTTYPRLPLKSDIDT